jgi:hypothetical protein
MPFTPHHLLKTRKTGWQLCASDRGLTALIAGIHDPQDFTLHNWGNPDAGLQPILRNLFPRMSPYMHEYF